MLASSYITPKAIKGHPSGIHGHGLVAVTPISKDEIVAIKGGHIVDTATVRSGGRPASLKDLSGPATGTVVLPLHVAWSGRRAYDVSDERQRLMLYALLLAEAQRVDLERFLNRESLVSMWPRLRPLLGPHARRAWEQELIPAHQQ